METEEILESSEAYKGSTDDVIDYLKLAEEVDDWLKMNEE